MVKLKRIYDAAESGDGFRILVDRVWPRGISKERAKIDVWLKEVAPSGALRKWFAHDPKKWGEFQKRYVAELKDDGEALRVLRSYVHEHKIVTLLFGAKDEVHNQAVVLKELCK